MTDGLLPPEVEQLLKVIEKSVYTMAQKGEFPAFKVRGQLHFKRVDFAQWLDEQKAVSARNQRDEP